MKTATVLAISGFTIIPSLALPQTNAEATSLVAPAAAIIKYKPEDTPLYAMLSSYSRNLQFFYNFTLSNALENEAQTLGVEIDDLEQIAISLNRYSPLQQEKWINEKTKLCQPVLLGVEISDEYARNSLAQLDASDERNNEIARSILNEIGNQLGEEVKLSVTDRIYEYGKQIEFSKTDLVQFIDHLATTDHKSYLINECNVL